jgi:hypothetical protein
MIHCESRTEAEGRFAGLSEDLTRAGTELEDSVMLVSTKEYKKTSMRFFT